MNAVAQFVRGEGRFTDIDAFREYNMSAQAAAAVDVVTAAPKAKEKEKEKSVLLKCEKKSTIIKDGTDACASAPTPTPATT